MSESLEIRPVTGDRVDDVADLFGTSSVTRGCWCMWFIADRQDFRDGFGGGNRVAFEALAAADTAPLGLLAYRDGAPVGWCAVGPRARYSRAIAPRVKILAGRDPEEDDDVWLVPCFFTRTRHRRQGVTSALLESAVALAAEHGATAVEGFPRAAGQRPSPDDYLGREEVFATCGFECIARPTPHRAVMRRSTSLVDSAPPPSSSRPKSRG